jgi:flagellin
MEAIVAINNIPPVNSGAVAPQDGSAQQLALNPASTPAAAAAPTGDGLPTEADQIAAHQGLVAQASQTLEDVARGASQPDLTGEGARLLALHLQQSLAGQSLSIANQAPQSLLSLLR